MGVLRFLPWPDSFVGEHNEKNDLALCRVGLDTSYQVPDAYLTLPRPQEQ